MELLPTFWLWASSCYFYIKHDPNLRGNQLREWEGKHRDFSFLYKSNFNSTPCNYSSYIFTQKKGITCRESTWGKVWRTNVRHGCQTLFTKALPNFLHSKKGAPFCANSLFKRLTMGPNYCHILIKCGLAHIPSECLALYWIKYE